MDNDERILAAGLDLFPLDEREKQLTLEVIAEETSGAPAAVDVCSGVLHHIPPEDLDEFFAAAKRLPSGNGTLLLAYNRGDQVPVSAATWLSSFSHIEDTARRFSPTAQ